MSEPGPRVEVEDAAASSAPLERRCIAVQVHGAHYALPMDDVQEVIAMRPLTRVFHAPSAIAGVTSLRGEVLPVLDLGVLVGGEPVSLGLAESRIVVVREAHGQRRRAGLLVDNLAGLRQLPESGLEPPPGTLGVALRELVLGVIPAAPPCMVLQLTAAFAAPALARFAAGEDLPSA